MSTSQFEFLVDVMPDAFDDPTNGPYLLEMVQRAKIAEDSRSNSEGLFFNACCAVYYGLAWASESDPDLSDLDLPRAGRSNELLDGADIDKALIEFLPNAQSTTDHWTSNKSDKIKIILDSASEVHRHYRELPTMTMMDAHKIAAIAATFRYFFGMAIYYGGLNPDEAAQIEFDANQWLLHVPRTDSAEVLEDYTDAAAVATYSGATDVSKPTRPPISTTTADNDKLRNLQTRILEKKRRTESIPIGAYNWSEKKTRDLIIDTLLLEAGWHLEDDKDREYRVEHMAPDDGVGFVDYVLWDGDRPLALVEAKRTSISPHAGQTQAKLYAACLQRDTGTRPIIFCSNGIETWLLNEGIENAPRKVQGFLTRDELERLHTQVELKESLSGVGASLLVNDKIAGREYQEDAIHAICRSFATGKREALVVMATGAGKTRTVIGLVDLLQRANCAKRVLFLADRTSLVHQAVNAFKAHLPNANPINLITDGNSEGRIYASTYQTMVGKINEFTPEGVRRYGIRYFDLVIVDEAHRSVYRKYRGIFEYFDSLLVGLTATPKSEVDRNTYSLFGIRDSQPTYEYSLKQAIIAGYLVKPKAIEVPLKFMREGIKYSELSEDEKEHWDELDWGDAADGGVISPPTEVEATELNRYLFNTDTVDKALAYLMLHGLKVAGGDRLGKTIVFAQNQAHANFIYDRFILNYPKLHGGEFAAVITHAVNHAQQLIDKFTVLHDNPHIAISVDMLDTGIDVPSCVNLVFFKLVRSKTKFLQMLGRGTRLCPGLFGADHDKTHFVVFDLCGNVKYFNENIEKESGGSGMSLGQRAFEMRAHVLRQLAVGSGEHSALAEALSEIVNGMDLNNFLVKPHLDLVAKYRTPSAWEKLPSQEQLSALARLPSPAAQEDEDIKRFDIMMMRIQLRVLAGKDIRRHRMGIVRTVELLEGLNKIPAVDREMVLIQDLQSPDWWNDVTYGMLEAARRRLRLFMPLIEKRQKHFMITSITDELGEGGIVEMPDFFGTGQDAEYDRFLNETRAFLNQRREMEPVSRVYRGKVLESSDIGELWKMFEDAGIGSSTMIERASTEHNGLGIFVRSQVGLDRDAVASRFTRWSFGQEYDAKQIQFVALLVEEFIARGIVHVDRVYEDPYRSIDVNGPDSLFEGRRQDLNDLFQIIEALNSSASGDPTGDSRPS